MGVSQAHRAGSSGSRIQTLISLGIKPTQLELEVRPRNSAFYNGLQHVECKVAGLGSHFSFLPDYSQNGMQLMHWLNERVAQ